MKYTDKEILYFLDKGIAKWEEEKENAKDKNYFVIYASYMVAVDD